MCSFCIFLQVAVMCSLFVFLQTAVMYSFCISLQVVVTYSFCISLQVAVCPPWHCVPMWCTVRETLSSSWQGWGVLRRGTEPFPVWGMERHFSRYDLRCYNALLINPKWSLNICKEKDIIKACTKLSLTLPSERYVYLPFQEKCHATRATLPIKEDQSLVESWAFRIVTLLTMI